MRNSSELPLTAACRPRPASPPLISGGLAVLALLISLSPTLSRRLQYDRESIELHQLWRLFSCHWSHWSWQHLAWDTLAFVLLGIACERYGRRRLLGVLAVSSLLISLVIHNLLGGIGRYRGLSGLDAALLTLLLVSVVRGEGGDARRWLVLLSAATFLAFAAKLILELRTGDTVFVPWTGTQIVSLPVAHLLGAVVGIAGGLIGRPRAGRQLHCPSEIG